MTWEFPFWDDELVGHLMDTTPTQTPETSTVKHLSTYSHITLVLSLTYCSFTLRGAVLQFCYMVYCNMTTKLPNFFCVL